jgi:hypothetical protein
MSGTVVFKNTMGRGLMKPAAEYNGGGRPDADNTESA